MTKEDLSAPRPTPEAIARLKQQLHISTPIVALYDCLPDASFLPVVEAREHECCFAYYEHWAQGETLVVKRGGPGCPGGHRSFGLEKTTPTFMANFLTDGVGAPTGEGLRATPEVAQELLDRATPVENRSGYVLLGPVRVEHWDEVRSVTFFVDPDRISGLTTLAGYWSSNPDIVVAPFGSACSAVLRALGEYEDDDRAVLGGMDVAMRRHLPEDTLTLTVSPARFAKMLTVPAESFLQKPWWNDLMRLRKA